jgi:predicted transcriptional regulator
VTDFRPGTWAPRDREERRKAFRQDALAAWEAYRSTGLHLTAREVDAWLARLGQADDVEPPECHG